jgi:hypothetical protein
LAVASFIIRAEVKGRTRRGSEEGRNAGGHGCCVLRQVPEDEQDNENGFRDSLPRLLRIKTFHHAP